MEKYKSGDISKIEGLEELRKCRGKCEKTYNDCFDEIVEADADIVEARIEYEKGQESLWSRSWNHEIESIDAIGAVFV